MNPVVHVLRRMGGRATTLLPAAGALGREATVWLLDEDAASKL